MKKVLGFVLSFGYVESSRVSKIHLRHLHGYFESTREAAQNLAHYLLEDYLAEWVGDSYANVDGFRHFLYSLPESMASGGAGDETFDRTHANDEDWWPWDTMSELYPLLGMFYEVDRAEDVLIRFLDPAAIDNEALAQEVREVQTWDDGEAPEWWTELGDESIFTPIVSSDHDE